MPTKLFKAEETKWPPVVSLDETDAEREIRLEEEKEAKRISDEIDRSLSEEKERRKKTPAAKILLLGDFHY